MIRTFAELIDKAVELPDRRLAVAKAEEPDVLVAVERARQMGIASAVLVGEDPAIRHEMALLGINEDDYEIVDAASREEAAEKAVRMVHDGHADTLMKGVVDTNILLKAVLNKEWGLRKNKVISHVALCQVDTYPKLIAMSDGGMLMYPDLEQKAEEIKNALVVSRALGVEVPKVACIAAKEHVNPKMQATVDAEALAAMEWENAIVEGPIALDGAVSAEASATKGYESRIAGDVDILLMPAIEVGNVFYKTLKYLGRGECAGTIVGARRPIVLTSRSDDEEAKLTSIALAMVLADYQSGAGD